MSMSNYRAGYGWLRLLTVAHMLTKLHTVVFGCLVAYGCIRLYKETNMVANGRECSSPASGNVADTSEERKEGRIV